MSGDLGEELDAGADLAMRLRRVELVGCHSQAELEALTAAGFELTGDGYWRLALAGGFEVLLEPKIMGGHLLAVYRDRELVHAHKLDVELRPRGQGER